ncbi:MAG TPA: SpoIIE family protein phosphatase [Acidimicrobiales bacterium]|nr:SpoIIE family protein phosphatase [Acidimicrobiales bacterium]
MDWSQVVEAEPAGVLVADRSGHLTYLNRSAARALGRSAAGELIGEPVASVLGDFPAALRSSQRLPGGESVWYLAADRLAACEQDRFAVEVGDALAGTLNLRRTMGRIADLAVPRLGRWATVTLWDNDRIRQVSRGPDGSADDRAVPTRRLDDTARRRIRHAIEVDRNHMVVTTPAEMVELGARPDAALALLADGPVDVVTLALRAHGTALGTLAVTPRPGADDALLDGLARRAAVALSAARVYEERSTLAATLRNALVPAELPSPEGFKLGSVYRPALETTEIGGDFFEVNHEGPGWSFSVGDVCGKGVEAAVLTGQVRQSLATVSLVEPDPAERLRLLNATLLRTDGTSFVTVVHGVMEPKGDSLSMRLAAGGHPPPLLRRADGDVRDVPVSGPIIGMLPEVSFEVADFELGPGETLVCFTDGLPEARGAGGMLGRERLRRILMDCPGMNAQAIAERLLQATLEHLDGRPHDDMAVLAVQTDRR